MNFTKAIEFFIPQPCPYDLIRIGENKDGSYLIPNDLEGITACFSPGVNNQKDFEDSLSKNFNIRTHMCDYSSNKDAFRTPLIEGLQTFEKKWLDIQRDKDSINLEDWIADKELDNNGDYILQMDIEGAEYRNILCLSREIMEKFRIIVIEVHYLNYFNPNLNFKKRIKKFTKLLL